MAGDPAGMLRAKMLRQINLVNEPQLKNQSLPQAIERTKQRSYQSYTVLKIPLTGARNGEQYTITGDFFYLHRVVDASGTDTSGSVSVKFNRNDIHHEIPLVAGQGCVTKYDRFFLSNDATAGAVAEIIIGHDNEAMRFVDNRLATAISTISTALDVDDVKGFNTIPSTATVVAGRVVTNTGGANPRTVYTVTAGKTLTITGAGFGVNHGTGTAHFGLEHANTGGTLQKVLCAMSLTTSGANGKNVTFPKQIQAVATDIIRLNGVDNVNASITGYYSIAYVHGWEI